jgi:hypothetical protein
MKEVNGTGGAPQSSSGTEAETVAANSEAAESRKDVVQYDSYKKVLGEKKKLDEKLSAYEKELATLRDEKLSAEGKTAELLETTKKRLVETEGKYKKAVGSFAYTLVSSKVEAEAVKLGCNNINDLLALSDLSEIEVDDDFKVNVDQVKALVEKQRKERAYLFSKQVAGPRVGAGAMSSDLQPDWSKLSITEQARMAFGQMKK